MTSQTQSHDKAENCLKNRKRFNIVDYTRRELSHRCRIVVRKCLRTGVGKLRPTELFLKTHTLILATGG